MIDSMRLPGRLADLGFTLHNFGGVEAVVPPTRQVPPDGDPQAKDGDPQIPRTWFIAGSDPERDPNTVLSLEPQWWVWLPYYEIARFPVTVAEYACFVRNGRRAPDGPPNSWSSQLQNPDRPVTYVSMSDAQAYAAWLARLTRQPWRVPTMLEWEKAARWDPRTCHSRLYPWGDFFTSEYCNCDKYGMSPDLAIMPVGMYPQGASPCGAEDMSGNVVEHTIALTEFAYHAVGSMDVQLTTIGTMLRGGSYEGKPKHMRAAWSTGSLFFANDTSSYNLGFRLVLTPHAPFTQCKMYPHRYSAGAIR